MRKHRWCLLGSDSLLGMAKPHGGGSVGQGARVWAGQLEVPCREKGATGQMCPRGTPGCLGGVTTGHRQLQLWGGEKDHPFVSLQPAYNSMHPFTTTTLTAHLQPNSLPTHARKPSAHPSTPMTPPIHPRTLTSPHPSPPTALHLVHAHLQPAVPQISTSIHPQYSPKEQLTNKPTAPPILQQDTHTLHSSPQMHPHSSHPPFTPPVTPPPTYSLCQPNTIPPSHPLCPPTSTPTCKAPP